MKIAQLDNVAHAELALRQGAGAALGDPVGQIEIVLTELAQVQREYPILFTRRDGAAPVPVALLGIAPDELLFETSGQWDARHVPALVRKGPFLLGGGGEDPLVHVQLDHPRLAPAGTPESQPLFLPHGGHAPALEEALDALRLIHAGLEPTRRMAEALDQAGLIQPLAIDIQLSDAQSVTFANFHAVLPEAIDALAPDVLAELARAGFLQPAVLIAHSLGSFNDLIRRKRMRGG